MSSISRTLRTAALMATATALLAAPAVAQRGVPGGGGPSVPPPNVPVALPGETGGLFAAGENARPDALGRRGHHQGQMLARGSNGEAPNQPVYEPTISGDGRINRYIAFTTAATNVVAGSGTFRNLFVTKRAPGATVLGNNWKIGSTMLITKGKGGPADGDSWGPSFSGFDQATAHNPKIFAPKCLAFVSNASNLVAGDNNGRSDAFIKRMPGGKISRANTPAAVTEVAMDGLCRHFVYVAGGALYWAKPGGAGKKKIMGGGATKPEVSANGKTVVFERNGQIFGWVLGRGVRHIAAGSNPTSEEWGRTVAYTAPSGNVIFDKIIPSAPSTWCQLGGKRLSGGRCQYAHGTEPSMTAGGHFAYFAQGDNITGNVYKDVSYCPTGSTGRQVHGSAHGNYLVYGCSNGRIYLSYVGGY